MNKIFILFILLSNHFLYAQNDSVIILEEVIINNNTDNNNYTSGKIKNKDKTKETLSLSNNYSFVTKNSDDKIINQNLKTVEFFFDKIKEQNNEDVFFELILLDQNNNGDPGKSLNTKPFLFKINNKKKNSIKLDLEKYKINIDKPFFIGLRKLNNSKKYDFRIYIIESNKKQSDIYINIENQKWLKPPNFKNNTIKINIETIKPED